MGMPKTKPWGLRWRSSTFFIIATVGTSLFTDLFLFGLIIPLLPFILRDRLHIEPDQIQVHVSGLLAAYAAASLIFSLVAGIIADLGSSRKLSFLAGLIALLIATIMLFLGQSVTVVALARVLQGASAAVVWTVGLALLLDTVGSDDLGKTLGSIFSFIAGGQLVAPAVGGILYHKTGYTGVFALASSILVVDIAMRFLLIEKSSAARYKNEDEDNIGGIAEPPVEESISDANEEEDSLLPKKEEENYRIVPSEHRLFKAFPMLLCLGNPRLLTTFFLTIIQASTLTSFDATIPTVAVEYFDVDSLQAGLLFVATVVPCIILGPLAGWMVDRYGTKPIAVFGYCSLVPALLCLRLVQPGGTQQMIGYAVILAVCGVGIAFIGPPGVVEASFIVKRYHQANPGFFGEQGPYAQLYALSSMAFSLGMTIGPILSGLAKQRLGYGNMNAVLAGVCLFTATLSFVYIGGKPRVLKRI